MSKFQLGDPRNEHLFAWIGDRLLPREQAKVSAFDSAVQGGDAVWEGLRIYDNKVFKLEEHLHRLVESAKAMAFANVPSLAYIRRAIGLTLEANNMSHNTHIRLSLTRGPKLTSSMNPAFNVFGCTLIVLPEFKTVGDMTTYDNKRGIRLVTACNRRNPAQCVDSKIHHCNLINNNMNVQTGTPVQGETHTAHVLPENLPFEGLPPQLVLNGLRKLTADEVIGGKTFWKSYDKWEKLNQQQITNTVLFVKNKLSDVTRSRLYEGIRGDMANEAREEKSRQAYTNKHDKARLLHWRKDPNFAKVWKRALNDKS
eukprot:gene13228-15274_t